jgi:hypothetical protein
MNGDTLKKWLMFNDVPFFVEKVRVGAARKQFIAECGPVSAAEFRKARNIVCRYWMSARRYPVHKTGMLTVKGWERTKRAVQELRADIDGVGLRVAVELVGHGSHAARWCCWGSQTGCTIGRIGSGIHSV